jgi:S-adenosylmethionine:tRNA ribosyltransferase-isomerase
MNPRNLSITDFTYDLPADRIALYPEPGRDGSRLLVWDGCVFTEDIYRNISAHIPRGALMVFNRTRVVEARLLFRKPSGGKIEVFALEPSDEYPDITMAMSRTGSIRWKCLVGGAAKWKHGQVPEMTFTAPQGQGQLTATIRERLTDSFLIEFEWTPSNLSFAEVLHHAGRVPLPPYIKREPVAEDAERYQTIYARDEGSVAAPTAGLHFTPAIFASLVEKGIRTDYLTLHVGAGTFKPVQAEKMSGHGMHAEQIEVERSLLDKLIDGRHPVYAVGTTSLRTLESLYWLGRKVMDAPGTPPGQLELGQWEPYDMPGSDAPVGEALQALRAWMKRTGHERLIARTSLLVAPGYRPRMVDGLVTNFHQPRSTLLLLVAALMGDDWKRLYDEALERKFRMLSFGDGCLLHYRKRMTER